jgi:hypothetical protein
MSLAAAASWTAAIPPRGSPDAEKDALIAANWTEPRKLLAGELLRILPHSLEKTTRNLVIHQFSQHRRRSSRGKANVPDLYFAIINMATDGDGKSYTADAIEKVCAHLLPRHAGLKHRAIEEQRRRFQIHSCSPRPLVAVATVRKQ